MRAGNTLNSTCVSTRETGCAGGDARERPVSPARSAACRRRSWALATGAVRPRPGSVPVVRPGWWLPLPAHRGGAAWPHVPGGQGASRWPLPGGQRGLPAAAPGARRPHQGHRRLAACPQTWPAVPPASAAARGRRPDAPLPGPGAVPHPPLAHSPRPGRCPRPGPGGMRYTARHPTTARLPPPGPPGRGHDAAAAVTCALTAMARIWRGCPGRPGAAGMARRDWRWRAASTSCGQPLVPTGSQNPGRIFSNHTVLAGAPLRNRTVDLLLTMYAGFVWRGRARSGHRRSERYPCPPTSRYVGCCPGPLSLDLSLTSGPPGKR